MVFQERLELPALRSGTARSVQLSYWNVRARGAWRKERDSNSRDCDVRLLSKELVSTAHPPFRVPRVISPGRSPPVGRGAPSPPERE